MTADRTPPARPDADWRAQCSAIEDAVAAGRMTAPAVFTRMRTLLAATGQQPAGEPVARILHWHGPAHMPVPHGGICARTFVEFPKDAGKDGYWKEGVPLYATPTTQALPAAAPGDSDADRAAWLADKIVALGDYAKEAAAMLRRWPAAAPAATAPTCPNAFDGGCAHPSGDCDGIPCLSVAAPAVPPPANKLLSRLREAGNDYTVAWGTGDLYDEAADEIERLRAMLTAAPQAPAPLPVAQTPFELFKAAAASIGLNVEQEWPGGLFKEQRTQAAWNALATGRCRSPHCTPPLQAPTGPAGETNKHKEN